MMAAAVVVGQIAALGQPEHAANATNRASDHSADSTTHGASG